MATELKSYTIVPDSLYVERKADVQLHNIVEAMQRPGYVLVSRQMEKQIFFLELSGDGRMTGICMYTLICQMLMRLKMNVFSR